MGRCVIFCAGGFDRLIAPVEKNDYIIAADGGYTHIQALGIQPNAVLGDFDSLGYTPENAVVFPVEKDDTDAMLAVRHGLSLGYKDFLIYGALDGPRLDHTLAALQTLLFLAEHDARGVLVGLTQVATAVKNETAVFPRTSAGILSLFAIGEIARGVTLTGLQYRLTDGELSPRFPLGVSNHFTGEEARVTVKDGTLIMLWDRQNPLPKRT